MKRGLVLIVAVLAAYSTGCSGARYVRRAGDEGIVAIPDNTNYWPSHNRTTALALIEAHVGPDYDIIEEKEVSTGQQTTNQQNTNNQATLNPVLPIVDNRTTTTSTTTVREMTEYQIHYRKRMGLPVGTPSGGPGPVGGLPMAPGVTPAANTAPNGAPSAPVIPAGASSFSPGAMTGGSAPGLPPPNLTGITGACPTCK